MAQLSFRGLSLKGKQSMGLRGWSGKPLHPPLTDIPITAYLLTAVFDVISLIGQDEEWGRDFYRAATFALMAGAAASLFTALTGFLDWRTTEPGTEVRRQVNAHALTMITVTVLVLLNVAFRVFSFWGDPHTPVGLTILSVVIAVLTTLGAGMGGSLVFEHGFNVKNAQDTPAYHR